MIVFHRQQAVQGVIVENVEESSMRAKLLSCGQNLVLQVIQDEEDLIYLDHDRGQEEGRQHPIWQDPDTEVAQDPRLGCFMSISIQYSYYAEALY